MFYCVKSWQGVNSEQKLKKYDSFAGFEGENEKNIQ